MKEQVEGADAPAAFFQIEISGGQSLRDVVRTGRVRDIQRNVYCLTDFPQLIRRFYMKNGVITRGM